MHRGESMKRFFIRIKTNMKYLWPFLTVAVVQFLLWTADMLATGPALFFLMSVGLAAFIMSSGRWWGCLFGSLSGIYCIAEHYCKIMAHEKIIIDERPFGAVIIVYYILIGLLCWKENRKV